VRPSNVLILSAATNTGLEEFNNVDIRSLRSMLRDIASINDEEDEHVSRISLDPVTLDENSSNMASAASEDDTLLSSLERTLSLAR
jgi:hypothetical protein